MGDITGRVFNLAVGYAWDPAVHQNILYSSIGLGAGIGAYLGWINLDRHWYFVLPSVLIVLAAGVAGAYLGRFYGPGVEPGWWWSRFATDQTVYVVAAALSVGIATILGLIHQVQTRSRLQAYVKPMPPAGCD